MACMDKISILKASRGLQRRRLDVHGSMRDLKRDGGFCPEPEDWVQKMVIQAQRL